MSTELEEIVVDVDRAAAEQRLPNVRESLLDLIAGRHPRRARRRRRRWPTLQSSPINLAIGQLWQRIKHHEGRRHHVLGQRALQELAQHFRGWRRPVGRNKVRNQLPVPGAFFDIDDHYIADPGMLLQHRLDFPELDAKAPDLHLLINAADILDDAVVGIARQVSGLVEHPVRIVAERVRDKALLRQLGSAQIASRQSRPRKIQFAGDSNRHRLALRIQDVRLHVVDRSSDGYRTRPRVRLHLEPRGIRRHFRRAVQIQQYPSGQPLEEPLHELDRQHLAATDPVIKPRQPRPEVRVHLEQHPQQRRHQDNPRHSAFRQRCHQPSRILRRRLGNQYRRNPLQQWAKDLPH